MIRSEGPQVKNVFRFWASIIHIHWASRIPWYADSVKAPRMGTRIIDYSMPATKAIITKLGHV